MIEQEARLIYLIKLLAALLRDRLIDPVLVIVEGLGADVQLEVGELGENLIVEEVALEGETF